MSHFRPATRRIFAPAKINLFLHVTGRYPDGYHQLDSLVVFADIGDELVLEPSVDFSFEVSGQFAGQFSAAELDCSPNSRNLVVQAVWKMAEASRRKPGIKASLKKNLPLASGLGGGSADAAAIIWELMERWGLPRQTPFLDNLMEELGADVPACLDCRAVRVRGKGERLQPVKEIPEMPVLLVNPGAVCKTGVVFSLFPGPFSKDIEMGDSFASKDALIEFLRGCDNDLTCTAASLVPEIEAVLSELKASKGALLSRMCGSGATCFALFDDEEEAFEAAESISFKYPLWWVRSGWINRPQRY